MNHRRRLTLEFLSPRRLLDGTADNAPASVSVGADPIDPSTTVTREFAPHTDELVDQFVDQFAVEALAPASSSPHVDGSVEAAEHAALLALMPHEQATHRAVQSGLWNDPDTWENHLLPSNGAHVLVPTETVVELDGILNERLATLRIDGELHFAAKVDTVLRVDTLAVASGGRLEIGTAQAPIDAEATARVVFLDHGPIDAEWDPTLLSRGLISHGSISIVGAAKTAHVNVATPAPSGATSLDLASPVVGWRVGDRILVPGVRRAEDLDDGESIGLEDEVLRLVDVSSDGRTITLATPLRFDHLTPRADLTLPIANLDRNVIFASENVVDPQRAGHVMFMHNPAVTVSFASFHNLGRNDKNVPTSDPALDENGRLIANTGSNPRGRYAVHFHRTDSVGASDSAPATVTGSVVENGPGWGFVNHASNVDFRENIAYDVQGAGFVAEVGSERGAMIGNLAVRSRGDNRHQVQGPTDKGNGNGFGSEGHGFWIHSPAVDLIDNVAAGQAQEGFVIHGRLVTEPNADLPTYYPLSRVPIGVPLKYIPEEINPALQHDGLRGDQLPFAANRGNRVFASGSGISVRWRRQPYAENPDLAESVIEDFQIWNVRWAGVHMSYADGVTLRRGVVLGDLQRPLSRSPAEVEADGVTAEFHTTTGRGVSANRNVRLVRIDDVEIAGFAIGVEALANGETHIDNVRLSNIIDIRATTPQATVESNDARRIYATRVVHVPLPLHALGGQQHFDVQLVEQFRRDPVAGGDLPSLEWQAFTASDEIYYNGYRLFFRGQAADAVPFAANASPALPSFFSSPAYHKYLGLANQMLLDQWNVALGGAVAPPLAFDGKSLQIDGLVVSLDSLGAEATPETILPPLIRVDAAGNDLAWTLGNRSGTVLWQTAGIDASATWRVYLVQDRHAIPIGISGGPTGFADITLLPPSPAEGDVADDGWQTWQLKWDHVGQQAIHHPDRLVAPGQYVLVATALDGPSVYLGKVTIAELPVSSVPRSSSRPTSRTPIPLERRAIARRGNLTPIDSTSPQMAVRSARTSPPPRTLFESSIVDAAFAAH